MQPQLPLNEIKQKISSAKSILIVLPQLHSVDIISGGLALYLALEQNYGSETKDSKRIFIASSTDVTVAYQRLYGVGDIAKKLGSKNLVVSLNTDPENIEKISYDNENSKINIVIETKNGMNKLSKNEVEFTYRGVDADLVIAVGLTNPEQSGELIFQEPKLFEDRECITIAHQPTAVPFGVLNIHESESSGVSEIVTKLLRFLKIEINSDIATNLLAGIEAATNNFAVRANADTFAAISWCLRLNGRRNHLSAALPSNKPFTQPSPGFSSSAKPLIEKSNANPLAPFDNFSNPEVMQPAPSFIEDSKTNVAESDVEPQDDWFGPKIFKNNGTSKA